MILPHVLTPTSVMKKTFWISRLAYLQQRKTSIFMGRHLILTIIIILKEGIQEKILSIGCHTRLDIITMPLRIPIVAKALFVQVAQSFLIQIYPKTTSFHTLTKKAVIFRSIETFKQIGQELKDWGKIPQLLALTTLLTRKLIATKKISLFKISRIRLLKCRRNKIVPMLLYPNLQASQKSKTNLHTCSH